MPEDDIGKRIQYYRKKAKLSIKELSERAHLTSSMLSQIERGIANPSLNTLRSLASILNIAVFQLFLDESSGDENPIVTPDNRIKIVPPQADEQGVTYELLTPNITGSLEFTILTLQPGFKSNHQLTSHIGEEVNYVLSGKMTFYYKDRVYHLNQGDSVRVPPNTPHLWYNESNEVSRLIFASTPTSF
jgi:transcriptional regulator with XRE-family HTH domain